MPGLVLVLSLAGLGPTSFLPKSMLVPTEHVRVSPESLWLELDLAANGGALDELGQTLGRGIGSGPVHLGLDGVPESPFLSNFLHAYEIRVTTIDPQTLAGNLMLQLRVSLD